MLNQCPVLRMRAQETEEILIPLFPKMMKYRKVIKVRVIAAFLKWLYSEAMEVTNSEPNRYFYSLTMITGSGVLGFWGFGEIGRAHV